MTELVYGIICNVCGDTLPVMTMEQHLDVNCILNYQCRCYVVDDTIYESDTETDNEISTDTEED